ncbi:MAG: 1,4-dihydroxy-2-naphthoate polyprenyltransferase [Anaerophaga sp.]|nr:1,4-dihydroxy-2-naphthoate polyprenyltransferase [Anaerophaga sp.]
MALNIKAWIISFRLRTLPLALSGIFMGSILAAEAGSFKWPVFIWALLTALFLQILSNLANDYGDALSGADNEERQGPRRMIQGGVITLKQMKRAVIVTATLALISGMVLIFVSLKGRQLAALAFFILGLLTITAAIRYTVGRNPYGYRGFGDFYVFLFFGLMGVGGTFFLHAGMWEWPVLLPASAVGFFSTGVLNLNNIRDIESDKKSGKKTLPVMMGRKPATFYHLSLLVMGWIAFILWLIIFHDGNVGVWLPLIVLPVFVLNAISAFRFGAPSSKLDSQLRNLSLGTLFLVIFYGTGSLFIIC